MLKQPFQRNKRLRVFGGPNGSGKSTILSLIDSKYDIGYYINADEIEKQLGTDSFVQLSDYGIRKFEKSRFKKFVQSHTIINKARSEGYVIDIEIEGNRIINPNTETHSYEAALIADFLRYQLLKEGKKMTFETVMSHHSKLEFLHKSRSAGYKNYLYYISTEDPRINVARVKQRVELGGHPVRASKILKRYYNSMQLLRETVSQTYRTFIFDNSGSQAELILEIFNGSEITYNATEIPKWIDKYLLS